jgi:hypothetical protein
MFPVFEGLFSEGFGWGLAEVELPFSKNLFCEERTGGHESYVTFAHCEIFFYFAYERSDCVTEHATEISLLIIRKGQSVHAVEIGPVRPERDPKIRECANEMASLSSTSLPRKGKLKRQFWERR